MKKILLLLVFLFSSAFSAYALEEVYYGLKKVIRPEGEESICTTAPIFSPDDKYLIQSWQIDKRGYIYIYDTETWDTIAIYDSIRALFFRDSLLFANRIGATATVVLHYPDYEVVKELPYVPDDVTSLINGKRYLSRGNSIFDYETGERITCFVGSYLSRTILLDRYSSKVYVEANARYDVDDGPPDVDEQYVGDFLGVSDTVHSSEMTFLGHDEEPLSSVGREWIGKERLKIPRAKYGVPPNIGNKPIRYIDFKNGEDFTDDREFSPITNQMDENMNYKYWKGPGGIIYTYWNQVWIPQKRLHMNTTGLPSIYYYTYSNSYDDMIIALVLKDFILRIYGIDSVVSVGDSVQADKPLVVYSNGELRITPPSNNYSIIISDLAGAVILERQFTNALDALIVNVSGWTRGMYLINITDAKGNSYPYKFVQEK